MAQVPEPPETVEVEVITVSCDGDGDGGGGGLGHPKVYLTLEDGEVECPYCDKKFVLKPGVIPVGGH